MSRIVVKNLPNRFNDRKLRQLFDGVECGVSLRVTDVQLKYTKSGKFRQFAFVGFKNDSDAAAAVKHFHGTFVGASKIKVEICTDLVDLQNKPRSWSKHTVVAKLQNDNLNDDSNSEYKDDSKIKNVTKNKYDNDPLFAEFVEVHKSKSTKAVWGNDIALFEGVTCDRDNDFDSTTGDNTQISDLEYLKSKIVLDDNETPGGSDHDLSITLRSVPLNATKSTIKKFLMPAKVTKIRRPRKTRGLFHVGLSTDEDLKLALNKHRSFLDGHRVCVTKCKATSAQNQPSAVDDNKFNKFKNMTTELEKSAECIAESGILFVRNLSYQVTEEELEALFTTFGPVAEIRLPVDRFTRKVIGFAVITFVIPEHAAKAFCQLDGTTFQGRNLHVLPGKAKNNGNNDKVKDENGSSYKNQNEAKKKAQSGSSHNWNALFLGANAVADIVSDKYDISKQDLLNVETDESIAVRMALGETQIVCETRKFLIENGIELDSFSQPSSERSKRVILAKNLPASTSVQQVRNLFEQFGLLGRVILPPSGITAVVEFEHTTEAKNAFTSLAYTKFKNSPLYLEWAPIKIFNETERVSNQTPESKAKDNKEPEQKEDVTDDELDADEKPEPERETTIFVKNLSGSTTDESLRKHFERCGQLHSVEISKKKVVSSNFAEFQSMGYGFVRYMHRDSCLKAMRLLQNCLVDDCRLTLKLSDRATRDDVVVTDKIKEKKNKKLANDKKPKTTKILVRNIPFEANKNELKKLFRTFGELKAVRLPQKMAGPDIGSHRGFAFVDFISRSDAKRAFNALCHSTHFYGRRLVLEWAETDEESVESLRRKTAQHFHDDAPSDGAVRKRARRAAVIKEVERIAAEDM